MWGIFFWSQKSHLMSVHRDSVLQAHPSDRQKMWVRTDRAGKQVRFEQRNRLTRPQIFFPTDFLCPLCFSTKRLPVTSFGRGVPFLERANSERASSPTPSGPRQASVCDRVARTQSCVSGSTKCAMLFIGRSPRRRRGGAKHRPQWPGFIHSRRGREELAAAGNLLPVPGRLRGAGPQLDTF